MATLENCPVCGNKTSSNAEQCPSCGEPLGEGWAEKLSTDKKVKKGREKKKKGRAFWVVVAIFLLPFFLLTFFSGEPESVREAPIKEKAELPTSKDPANGSLARETPKKDTIFTNTPERENPSKNSSGSESKEPKPHIQQAVVRKNNPSSQAKSRQNIFKWVASSRGASIYSKPSQTSLIIGKVLAGKEVHATALSGIWVEAVFESGANGWLMAGDLWRERDDGSPPYTIVRSDSLHPHKLSYDIGLDKKATESQLRGIAQELYKFSSGSKFDRVFIVYLLRDTSPASGAWATSHFNPNLDVRISGATIEQDKKFETAAKSVPGTLVGAWQNDGIISIHITIYRESSAVHMIQQYNDGGSRKSRMKERKTARGLRFDYVGGATAGDHYVLLKSGY